MPGESPGRRPPNTPPEQRAAQTELKNASFTRQSSFVPTSVDELSTESLTSSQETRHEIVPVTTAHVLNTSVSASVVSSSNCGNFILPSSTQWENDPGQVLQSDNSHHIYGSSNAVDFDFEDLLTNAASVFPVDDRYLSERVEDVDTDISVVDSPGPGPSVASDSAVHDPPKKHNFSTQTDESSLQEAAALKGPEQKGGKWTFMFFWALLQNTFFEGNLAKWVDEPNLIFQVIEGSTKAVSDLWGTLDVSPYHPSWDNLTGRIRYSLKKKEGYFIDFYKDPKFTKLPRKRCFRFTKHVQELIGEGRINEGQFRRIKDSLDKRSSTQNGNGSKIAE